MATRPFLASDSQSSRGSGAAPPLPTKSSKPKLSKAQVEALLHAGEGSSDEEGDLGGTAVVVEPPPRPSSSSRPSDGPPPPSRDSGTAPPPRPAGSLPPAVPLRQSKPKMSMAEMKALASDDGDDGEPAPPAPLWDFEGPSAPPWESDVPCPSSTPPPSFRTSSFNPPPPPSPTHSPGKISPEPPALPILVRIESLPLPPPSSLPFDSSRLAGPPARPSAGSQPPAAPPRQNKPKMSVADMAKALASDDEEDDGPPNRPSSHSQAMPRSSSLSSDGSQRPLVPERQKKPKLSVADLAAAKALADEEEDEEALGLNKPSHSPPLPPPPEATEQPDALNLTKHHDSTSSSSKSVRSSSTDSNERDSDSDGDEKDKERKLSSNSGQLLVATRRRTLDKNADAASAVGHLPLPSRFRSRSSLAVRGVKSLVNVRETKPKMIVVDEVDKQKEHESALEGSHERATEWRNRFAGELEDQKEGGVDKMEEYKGHNQTKVKFAQTLGVTLKKPAEEDEAASAGESFVLMSNPLMPSLQSLIDARRIYKKRQEGFDAEYTLSRLASQEDRLNHDLSTMAKGIKCLLIKEKSLKRETRWLKLTSDTFRLICQKNTGLMTKKQTSSGEAADISGIYYGPFFSTAFDQYLTPRDDGYRGKSWLTMTIDFPDQLSLNLVFPDEHSVTTWFLGLQALAPMTSYFLSRGAFLWQRLIMKLNYYGLDVARGDVDIASIPAKDDIDEWAT